ncbi:E3 ubiquitin-protein ligase RLIM [Carex littledalei]|uniref:E3 ubiquitin-protein ligase RLIM n=1 Tax=Carex littledalei TaxID=544730 RepID=A0A833VGA3_9POAL|nr:E3 ubiquitin-protein ligase RLIM [Carex littledalei]
MLTPVNPNSIFRSLIVRIHHCRIAFKNRIVRYFTNNRIAVPGPPPRSVSAFKGSINNFHEMNPELSLEVPDTPDRIRKPVNLQPGRLNQNARSRNLRLGLNGRVEQATPKDDQRKRKSPSSVILISESSISESRCNKKGKSVVQEVEDESRRGPTFRDNKERSASSKEDANASKRSEVEADRKEIVPQPSAVMLRRSGAQGPQHAGSSSGGGAGEDALLSEIVADDLLEGVIRSTRELGATTTGATSNTSSWRSTHSNRPGRFNQTSTGSSRPNPVVSTASTHVTAQPISGALTSTNSTGEIGAHPRQRGRTGSSSSLHRCESSSMIRNLGTATNLSMAARARGRTFRAQGVVVRPVIDVDEIHSPDSGAAVRARQLAHDEMIARRLQEELYNEIPGDWGMEEMDARIAMSLQQEENAMRASPIHRRAPRAGRSAQFVNASSFVRNNAAQQMHRDFNPHDYEALLALDEDNHQHTGASTSQINSLPESVVKSCNFEEPCAVCLETPSIGETIRHLPCLHKFHKDCIDQWLQRKKECPVCKCSIFCGTSN